MHRFRIPRLKPRAHTERGIALIEVLVSILIFSLGLLGLIGLQARAVSFSTDAEDRNRAAMLANELSTVMWLGNSVTVDATALSNWQTRVSTPSAGGLPNGAGTVTVTAGVAEIVITWRPPSRASGDSRFVTRMVMP
ncbi:type IV pilus modification protein PilV [Variovorax sp. JS1663]|uniref:type IV pilus modification protein PilV n=1 Tax=Variovorax sp. JS1663 TaxID=1851577 RepID=UPI000B34A173|nr:type IV pilus modification protein PilV [Variovorax sp. JS1663]OUM03777.1 type IV pilus modification protein PilV [Variovorax sp. JS1663]